MVSTSSGPFAPSRDSDARIASRTVPGVDRPGRILLDTCDDPPDTPARARIRNTPSAHRPKHRPRIPLMTYPETFLRHRDIPVVQALGVFPQAGSRKQEKWTLT